MNNPTEQPAQMPDPLAAREHVRCAFCNDPLAPEAAKRFRAELLCKECAAVVAAAHRGPRLSSTVAERAAAIDTAAIATNRVALGAVLSILSIGGVFIGAIVFGHFTKDTWEFDSAARIRALAEEAQRLDTNDARAALAKYQELAALVGTHDVRDMELSRIVEAARSRLRALESQFAAELAREREADLRQEEAARERQRREEEARVREEQRHREETERRETARQREQERREREAQQKPIEISDIGLKLIDSSSQFDYCTYSWKATVTNRTAEPITVTVILTMYDSDGFELESDYQFGVAVRAGEARTVTGQSMTRLSVYNRVDKYGVGLR